jgi:integrase
MEEGRDLGVMMPYLSQYLGHANRAGTFYYYHQVQAAFRTVRRKDTVSDLVIPEVTDYEE